MKRRKVALVVILFALSIVCLHRVILRAVPWALTELEGLAPVGNGIVTLAGDSGGQRVEHAVELLKQGAGGPDGKLILSGGSIYRETTWAELMRRRALELGVPLDRIVVQDKSTTTLEDARFTADVVRSLRLKRVVVVTSPWHSRRALKVFRLVAPDICWVSSPSRSELPDEWWKDPDATRCIASEVLKYFWPER
jgi:uncharacterized SAM-binding protein YcdF (DUF218 family)